MQVVGAVQHGGALVPVVAPVSHCGWVWLAVVMWILVLSSGVIVWGVVRAMNRSQAGSA